MIRLTLFAQQDGYALEALDDMLLYLASDASKYVTGSVMTVDDGQSLTGS